MKHTFVLLPLISSVYSYLGFNYGAVDNQGAALENQTYFNLFLKAQRLPGGHAFNSARLYTMIQACSGNDPTSAIPAAIASRTTLLLGLWASADPVDFENELLALTRAIDIYGKELQNIVVGISVGSEDLYRDSEVGLHNKAGVGKAPNVIINYIKRTRLVIADTILDGIPIGHVDTWNSWVNATNHQVIENCDFIGWDGYPYWQNNINNHVYNSKDLFWDSINNVKSVSLGKPIWITEIGWPVTGNTFGNANANIENAEYFWKDVGCEVMEPFQHAWWYTMLEKLGGDPNPDFSIIEENGGPLFDLQCPPKFPLPTVRPVPAQPIQSTSCSPAPCYQEPSRTCATQDCACTEAPCNVINNFT